MFSRVMVLAAFVLLSTNVLAQSGGIIGRAMDSAGQPLPGVAVTLMPAPGGPVARTTTANDGTYRFAGLAVGTYRVDFELRGFDAARRNSVRVTADFTAVAHATLQITRLCECILAPDNSRLAFRVGQVVDAAGRPLPRARLEVVTPNYTEATRADSEGRFAVRLPPDTAWSLTASDSGFRPVTQRVSGSTTQPIMFALTYAGESGVPELERLDLGCRCAGNLFRHAEPTAKGAGTIAALLPHHPPH